MNCWWTLLLSVSLCGTACAGAGHPRDTSVPPFVPGYSAIALGQTVIADDEHPDPTVAPERAHDAE